MPSLTSFRLCVLAVLAASLAVGCRHVPASDEGPGTSLIRGPDAEAELEGPAFSGWAASCGEGDADACHRLYASLLHASRFDVAKLPGTIEGLERGCEAGIGDGCGAASLARSFVELPLLDATAFERACSLGSSWSCALHVLSVGVDPEKAEQFGTLLQDSIRRCQEVGDTCFGVAGALDVQPAQEVTPAQMLTTGCALEDSLSCYALGRMQIDLSERAAPGDGADSVEAAAQAMSDEDALRALRIACKDDIGPACHLLALQLFRGDGVEADHPKARALSREACMLGTREACDFLARTRGGRTFPPPEGAEAYPDEATFIASQRRYCELGGHQSCVRLAKVRLQAGTSAPTLAPVDEGLGLLVRTCDQRSDEACQILLNVVGSSTAACEKSRDANACLVAGAVWRRGLDVPASIGAPIDANPVRARDALNLACQAGRQAACSGLNSVDDGDSTSN